MAPKQHFCLTATHLANKAGRQFTVHVDGNINDAMRELKKVTGLATSHGGGCRCTSPATRHPENVVIKNGAVV